MLLNFKVKNFRSIKNEITLDLQATSDESMKPEAVFECGNAALLKTAVIYGPNASGKSNILKAFAVFRKMVLESLYRSNMPGELPSEFFKLSVGMENEPSFFEMTFLLDKEVYTYGFEIDKKQVIVEWLAQKKGKKFLFERKKQIIKSNKNYFKEASAELKKQAAENVLFLSLLSSNSKPISRKIILLIQNINLILDAKRGATFDYAFNQFLKNPDTANKMKEFMLRADFGISDIIAEERMISPKQIQQIPDKFKELFFKEDSKITERSLKCLHKKFDKKGNEVTAEALDFFTEQSNGTQQIFALSAPIIDTLENGKVLFIDELDAGIHPILCQYLVAIFNSKTKNPNNAQLIFTTHDVALLDEEFLRRDEIYFVNKDKYGATELFSLAEISERKGVNYAKRYLEGRYGALPYIADFENLKLEK
jgi:uncharacterized protein